MSASALLFYPGNMIVISPRSSRPGVLPGPASIPSKNLSAMKNKRGISIG